MLETPAETRPESGVRRRTRAAVVNAAIVVWARDWSASLAEIADHAAVSRSTLHRYFPDRQSLVDAARDRALGAIEDAASRGRCDSSATAAAELQALLRATIEVGDAVIYLFADPARFAEVWAEDDDDHADLREIVVRAQEEGAVAADVSPDWVISVFYSLVYIAAEAIAAGTLPHHRAGDVAVRTFFGGVGESPA